MTRRTPTASPRTHPLRLSPALARDLDAAASELSAESLAPVSRAALGRALLAHAVQRWHEGDRPSAVELARALASVEGDNQASGPARVATLAPAPRAA